jgi:hypothetical protein
MKESLEDEGYIIKLENGASDQAPYGMVKLAVDTVTASLI